MSDKCPECERLAGDLLALAAEARTDLPMNVNGTARLHDNGRLGCVDCGAVYGGPRFPDLLIDDEAFAVIAPLPPNGGLLCPNCINSRLEVAGLSNVSSAFVSGPMCNPLDPNVLHVAFMKTRIRELEQKLAASLPIADVRAWAESAKCPERFSWHWRLGFRDFQTDLLAWLDERETKKSREENQWTGRQR